MSSALKSLSEHVYYLPGGVNAAVVTNGFGEAVLVDTGQDKNSGRNLRKACEALGVTPVAIINTHAHADHFGGNDYLLRQFDVPVYAPPFEASLMQSPLLEPIYLLNGAKPLPEMMSKWLLAKPSRVDTILTPGSLEIAGITFKVIDTSGHAHVHYSLIVDGVLLAADAIFGTSLLEKYPLPFGQDIGNQRASAVQLADYDANVILPGHGEPTKVISDLIKANLAAFDNAANTVYNACQGGSSADILRLTCDSLGMTMTDIPRYTLNLCTVMAYLSYLRDEGKVNPVLTDNRLLWEQS
jgi:glyoxylase-like metal-dependent hydrolase (beta-lactamase superfamily II)